MPPIQEAKGPVYVPESSPENGVITSNNGVISPGDITAADVAGFSQAELLTVLWPTTHNYLRDKKRPDVKWWLAQPQFFELEQRMRDEENYPNMAEWVAHQIRFNDSAHMGVKRWFACTLDPDSYQTYLEQTGKTITYTKPPKPAVADPELIGWVIETVIKDEAWKKAKEEEEARKMADPEYARMLVEF
jgi:hypothetical protein